MDREAKQALEIGADLIARCSAGRWLVLDTEIQDATTKFALKWFSRYSNLTSNDFEIRATFVCIYYIILYIYIECKSAHVNLFDYGHLSVSKRGADAKTLGAAA